jgi:hypothetical protein
VREDFVAGFVETGQEPGGAAWAWVDWSGAVAALDAGRLVCSSSEQQVLRLAASLAEGVVVDVREAVSGLDAATIALVVQVIVHAAGLGECAVTLSGAGGR